MTAILLRQLGVCSKADYSSTTAILAQCGAIFILIHATDLKSKSRDEQMASMRLIIKDSNTL